MVGRGKPHHHRGLIAAILAVTALAAVALVASIGLGHYAGDVARLGPLMAWLKAAGKVAGLIAATLLVFQAFLAARLHWLDHIVPLNQLYVLHSWMGPAAVVLATIHPFLLYLTPEYKLGPVSLALWPVLLGVLALGLLWFIVVTSRGQEFLKLDFASWRRLHYLVFPATLIVFVHVAARSDDWHEGWHLVVSLGLAAAWLGLALFIRLFRPRYLAAAPWSVTKVEALGPEVTGIELKPPPGRRFAHLPGQFAFLRLTQSAVADEEHPFTIASAPGGDSIAMAIKASGDFTGTLGWVRAGDRAVVDGPYGQFSYAHHPPAPLVMMAGGIGITPMMSMLRDLAQGADPRPVALIWVARNLDDLVFLDELDDLEARLPGLSVSLVLTSQPDWEGHRGRPDRQMLAGILDGLDLAAARAFVCGPPAMMAASEALLRELGIGRVHSERFALTG